MFYFSRLLSRPESQLLLAGPPWLHSFLFLTSYSFPLLPKPDCLNLLRSQNRADQNKQIWKLDVRSREAWSHLRPLFFLLGPHTVCPPHDIPGISLALDSSPVGAEFCLQGLV